MDIEIKNLSRSFSRESTKALDEVSFGVASGSRIGLVGPNGSGKTTLMRAVMGLLHAEGDIVVNRVRLSEFQKHYKKKVSYVPQVAPAFASTVSSVVGAALKLKGSSQVAFEGTLNELHLDYGAIANKPFRRLSGGMKQKVMIAVALSSGPELLFLDEPTSSLDAFARGVFYRMCAALGERTTLLLTSHRIDEIRHIISHCIELDKGRIQFQGSTQEYLDRHTLCLIEVLPNDSTDGKPDGASFDLSGLGFSESSSGWWSQLVPKSQKADLLKTIQNLHGGRVRDFLVRDVEASARSNPL